MTKLTSTKGTALVTGGATRIGKAICLKLSAMGYNIALHYNHSKADAVKTAKEISRTGGSCSLFACDLQNEKQTRNLIENIYRKHKDLNVLINSASVFEKSNLQTATSQSWDSNMMIHGKTPFILIQHFAKVCKHGNIINILDTNITRNRSSYFAYLLSKKLLSELTMMSAVSLAPNIRINAIAPGLILPPDKKENSYLERLAKNIPLRKKGSPENITQSVEFLLKNDFMTGQILFNDGGEHLIS